MAAPPNAVGGGGRGGMANFSTRYTGLFIALQTFNASKKALSGYVSGFHIKSNQIKLNFM